MENKFFTLNTFTFLTLLVYTQDESNYKYFTTFFILLEHLIPYNNCKKRYKKFIKKYPLNKYINLTQWLSILHDDNGDTSIPHKRNVMNIQPSIWGPHGWEFLMPIAANTTNDDKIFNYYKQFFENLQYILPCHTCMVNYKNYINDNPLTKHTNILKWLIILHNKSSSRKLDYNKVLKNIKKNTSIYAQCCT